METWIAGVYAVTTQYLDWATATALGPVPQEQTDMPHARKVLDAPTTGSGMTSNNVFSNSLAVGAFKARCPVQSFLLGRPFLAWVKPALAIPLPKAGPAPV